MIDDLISRKAVMELIESKLTDGHLQMGDDIALIDAGELMDDISDIPVAYDLDKVINKLNNFPKLVVNQYPLHGEYLKKDAVINIFKANTEKNCLNCRVTKEDLSQEICNKCVDYSKRI